MSVSKATTMDKDSTKTMTQKRGNPLKERTRLHTKDIVYWLRRRYQQTNPNMNYLFFPEEVQKHLEVEKIFQRFDEDKSGKLGLGEFYKMLREANIQINIDDLRKFYQEVDEDHDVALDFREFKNCTLSEEANHHFGKMMGKLRDASASPEVKKSPKREAKASTRVERDEQGNTKDGRRTPFLPRTFGNLLNYITYGNKRKEITDYLNDKSLSYAERFEKFQELYDLKIGKDIYFQKYNEKFAAPEERVETKVLQSKNNSMIENTPKNRLSYISSFAAKPESPNPTNELLREANNISRQAREDAMKDIQQGQQKKHNMGRTGTADNSRSSVMSRKAFRSVDIQPQGRIESHKKLVIDTELKSNLINFGSGSKTTKAEEARKSTDFVSFDDQKFLLSGFMKVEGSEKMRKTKVSFNRTFVNKNDKSSFQFNHQDSQFDPIKEKSSEHNTHKEEKLNPLTSMLKKYVSGAFDAGQNRKPLSKKGSYSKSLLKNKEENSTTYHIPGDDIRLSPVSPSGLDSSDTEPAPIDWNEALKKKQINFEDIHEIRASKLPISYNNVSPTFAFYQANTLSRKSAGSLRNTPTLSTEVLFTSPRVPKPIENALFKSNSTQSPKAGHFYHFENPIKPFTSPAARMYPSTAVGGKREQNVQPRLIKVTGLTMPPVPKSKAPSRTQTQSQPRVRADKNVTPEN